MSAASALGCEFRIFASTASSAPARRKCAEKVRRTIKQLEIDGCQLPTEGLPVATSFEVMSKVSMNPFVPLNS
jgi:hypothetical protein